MKYLNIIGGIDGKDCDDMIREAYGLLAYYEELEGYNKKCTKSERKEIDDLVINVETFGGNLRLFMVLKSIKSKLPCKVITRCFGNAYSCGLYIFLLGDVRESSETASFLWHQLSYSRAGSIEAHSEYHKFAQVDQNILEKFIIEKTDVTKEMIEENKYRDWYMNFKEAKKLGIITKVVK